MERNRVGIVTFHRAHNIGAMLQAFALQNKLQEKYDSEIVDYRSEFEEKKYYSEKTLKEGIRTIYRCLFRKELVLFRKKKKQNFSNFQSLMNISKNKYNSENIYKANKEYDYFVAGSDQVWNPQLTKGDYNYFLSFADIDKRYSYAASFGGSQILDWPERNSLVSILSTYKSLLIRESRGLELLKSLGVKAEVDPCLVCDPVFLLSKEEWVSKLNLKSTSDKYILLFLVSPVRYALDFAKGLSQKTGFEVRYISSYGSYNSAPEWCKDYMTSGPIEFLELLMNAEFVVVSSFHGMALSIIFNKEFYYELNQNIDNANDRLIALADRFGLNCREITSEKINGINKIDYKEINCAIDKYKKESEKILFSSLQ